MEFFSKLLGKSNWKKTLIRDLVTLTTVDGNMDKEEIVLALKITTTELCFTEQKFVDLMENLDKVENVYPTKAQDKLAYIQYLLEKTYADGYLGDNEIAYMKIIAKRMNLSESAIHKAIEIIEKSSNKKDNNENDYSGETPIIKTIITSLIDPKVEIQTEEGITVYLSKLSKLSYFDLCIELSNVMAAKHNLMLLEMKFFPEKQKIVTDLTAKAAVICILTFGQETVYTYCNEDFRVFNALVNEIDEEVARMQLGPVEVGMKLLEKLNDKIS